ncbi:MAG: ROK family protein [Eubacteriales bacterium]|nr:ROK family protein [Eubacteriales bacterium]
MDSLAGRPKLLKQGNLTLIRKVIMGKKTATRAEIAEETKISSTTVRSLLAEMLENGEIESIGYDKSSGGRKAERYRFRPERYYGAAFCISDEQMYGLLVNVCGEIVEKRKLEVINNSYEETIVSFLDEEMEDKEIKSIGIGVPGVVEGGCYWKKRLDDDRLYKVVIGENLAQRYKLPVILENDLKAIAIGFGRCYLNEFPGEVPDNINMAYLHFAKGCISAGFITGGKIVRGYSNFAGELGLIPMNKGKLLDECMAEDMEDGEYVDYFIRIISWICAILNPQYVALGGSDFRENCIGPISDGLSSLLPERMTAEILYSPDVWHDYYDGMAYLTAGKMFDEVQFVKEQI